MANTLQFFVDTITSDRLSGTLVDDTTYSDPLRADTGLFVVGYKMNSDSTVASTLTVTGNAGDPETDDEFTFNLPADGWFRFGIVSVPDFDNTDTYSIYDAVFEPSTNKVYRSKQNGNTIDTLTNTVWWEEITSPGTLAFNAEEANESTNIDYLIYEVNLSPNSEYGYASEISEMSEECCKVECSLENLLPLIRYATIIDGMTVHSDRSEMSAAERLARRMEALLE